MLPQLEVLALAIAERIDEHALIVGEVAAERHVDDVLQRLDWFAAMTRQQLGFFAGQVQPWAIGGLFHFDRRRDPQGRR